MLEALVLARKPLHVQQDPDRPPRPKRKSTLKSRPARIFTLFFRPVKCLGSVVQTRSRGPLWDPRVAAWAGLGVVGPGWSCLRAVKLTELRLTEFCHHGDGCACMRRVILEAFMTAPPPPFLCATPHHSKPQCVHASADSNLAWWESQAN